MWSPKNNLKKKKKLIIKILTLWLTQNNQWVAVDRATQIHLLNSPPMTSSVEKKENEGDDDMYDMFEIYEQCEYILWIINVKQTKKKQKESNKQKKNKGIHKHVTQNRGQKSW